MHRRERKEADAVKHPLPDREIERNARHGKGHFDLIQGHDLPIEVLEKEIPASDLHDM